jgi:hypothetical protein
MRYFVNLKGKCPLIVFAMWQNLVYDSRLQAGSGAFRLSGLPPGAVRPRVRVHAFWGAAKVRS